MVLFRVATRQDKSRLQGTIKKYLKKIIGSPGNGQGITDSLHIGYKLSQVTITLNNYYTITLGWQTKQ